STWFSGARRPRGPSLASGRRSARRRACRRRRPESSGVGRRGRGRRLWVALAVPLLAACAVGPRYRRPAVPTPETTRGQRGPADPASLADSPWWAVFRDPALQALVEEAIRSSQDLRAAAARRGVLLTLVSDVAQAYFELLELDRELEITQGTTITFQDTLDLFRRRYAGGIGTLLEVSRASAALTQARAGIPELERQIVAK